MTLDCSPVFCAPERNHNRFCSTPEHTICDTNTFFSILMRSITEMRRNREFNWIFFYSELRRMWIIMGDILFVRYAYDCHNLAIVAIKLTSSNTKLKPIITMSCWERKMLNSKNSIKLCWPRFAIFDAINVRRFYGHSFPCAAPRRSLRR